MTCLPYSPSSLASALASLIPPSKDSVGARILKKMGWKPGQGIGPKITYNQLKLQDAQTKSQSGYLASITGVAGEEDEEAKKHMYPRRDTKLVAYERKEDSFGVGYIPGARLENFDSKVEGKSESSGAKISCKNLYRYSIALKADERSVAGFGLGALNDADEDDLDVYDSANFSSSTHRRHLAFDEGDANDDDESISLHKATKTKPVLVQTRQELKSSGLFRNGAPVLPGFVLSTSEVVDDQW